MSRILSPAFVWIGSATHDTSDAFRQRQRERIRRMQNNDAGGFTLSDKQYDHFLHTMTNPAPPTPAMMKAAEDIDRLQRNRRYHEIAKELGIGPGCSVDDHNRIMQILNAPNAPPVSPFARKEGKS